MASGMIKKTVLAIQAPAANDGMNSSEMRDCRGEDSSVVPRRLHVVTALKAMIAGPKMWPVAPNTRQSERDPTVAIPYYHEGLRRGHGRWFAWKV